ncbi:MAG: AAA family ATPase [Actinobacteria bacterium]|nr:AAA family ATPase [Actinomycetota bacterium]
MIVCPSCGEETPAGFPRCANCGASLTAAEPAREERKVVTVLFADLVGFTARAERLDPEEVRALQAPYWERIRSELERYGGTVEKFIGDAVMALFGAPTAHEDDPERAIRAALAIRDWAREEGELEIRIGITTGEALVALGARPEAGEGMASGDVVNTAARLQAAAPVNGILVDETTYRATERAITFDEAEPVEAKGKSQPVPAFLALETRARFGVDVTEDVQTPLVGRDRELDLLVDALARARSEREPQLVSLIGVPGIGKSRLVYELSRAVDADPDLISWRQGRSLPYGEGVTFWSLSEMAKAQAGILETDAADAAGEKLEHAVRAVLSDPSEADWVARQLRPLIGLASGNDLTGDRRSEAFAAWRRFFEGIAEQSPLVLVFDDLQWADDGVLDFIDHLLEWSSGIPLLVVATARPELVERRPGWGGGKLNAATVQVGALSETDTARLLGALLERAVLPAETQSALLARAGGNPLYAQEFVRMLADRGLLPSQGGSWEIETDGGLPLPESIQGIIAARLDVLSTDEKELLQDASVLGKVVWPDALATIAQRPRGLVEELLHGLRRKDFLRHERRSSVGGETQFTFLHLLTRDVAYGQIPRANRSVKHRLAAEWLESLPADRAEDRAEMIAHHYLSALELARSTGQETAELADRARLALREAGDRALALNAFARALHFYTAALDLWPQEDPERGRLLYRLLTAKMYGGVPQAAEFVEASEILLAAGERELAAEAAALAGTTETNRGSQDAMWGYIRRAEELIADATPSRSKAFVLHWNAVGYSLAGRSEEALRSARSALEIAETLGLDDIRANTLSTIGMTRITLGDPGGVDDQERSVEIARAANSADVMRCLGNLASSLLELGQIAEAREKLEEAAAEAQRFGSIWYHDWLRPERVTYLYYEGEWDEALRGVDYLEADLESGRSTTFMEGANLTFRARIRLARGDVAGALEDSSRSRDLGRVAKNPQLLHPALAAFAAFRAELGQVDEASAAVDELFEDWREHPVLSSVFWLIDLAYALVPLGRGQELEEALARVKAPTPWADAARAYASGDFATAAEVLAGIGAVPEAAYVRLRSGVEPEVRLALEFYRSVGAVRYVREGEAMLARTA